MGSRSEHSEPRWLDADEQQDWYAFAYLMTLLPGALEAQMQREAGIPQFDYMVLSALSMAPGRTLRMSTLAHYTGSTLSRLSNVATRLEKRGWIQRRPDPEDGRSTLAALTDAGAAKVEEAAPGHVAEVRRLIFDPLTRTQQRQLRTISHRILGALQAPPPPGWAPTERDAPGAH
jgi:DNA-binding MarR family transcriptional regulator